MPSVDGAVNAAKAPVGWIKAHPVVFVLLIVGVGLLFIRFRKTIVSRLTGVPVVGGRVVSIAGKDAATG